MPTNRTSRFAIVALTAVAPFALAASCFAADNTMGSAPIAKPAVTDSTAVGGKVVSDKDKDAKKSTAAKSGAADVKGATGSTLATPDKHSALDGKATTDMHVAVPADKAKSGTAKSGSSGSDTDRTTGNLSGSSAGANATTGVKTSH